MTAPAATPTIPTLLVPAHTWNEPFNPAPDRTLWNAHRPLLGEHHWESKSRWGQHYAEAPLDHERYAEWQQLNADLDAREIVLVTNADLVDMFDAAMRARGSNYTLHDCLSAGVTPQEAMSMAELPWHPEDTTANEALAELMK